MPLSTSSDAAAPPRRGRAIGLAAIVASVFISTLTLAILTPLLAMRLAAEGISGSWIGANAAAGSAGIFLVSLWTPWLGRKLGSFAALMLSILVMAIGVGLLPIFHSLAGWFVLRFLVGAGIAVHWVISEVWINTAAEESDRGMVIGLYVAALSLAYCVGYPLLLAIGTDGNLPLIVVTVTIVTAGIPILLARRLVPSLSQGAPGGAGRAIRRQPTIMGAALLAGFAMALVLSFFVIYAERTGMTERTALIVLSTVAVGNVVLQVPIGMLADRFGADRLLTTLAALALVGLALMPFLEPMGRARWPFLFLWGGSLGGFYTLSLTLLGRRFPADELAGANAAFVISYEIGGLLGAVAGGLGLDLWNPHGVPLALGLAYGLFILGSLIARRSRRRTAMAEA
jgi:MFS family permease